MLMQYSIECDPGVDVAHEDGCNINVKDFQYVYNTVSPTSYDLLLGSMDATAASLTATVIFYVSLALLSVSMVFKLRVALD